MIAKHEFEAEGWQWQDVATECQGFEGTRARIVLKNVVMMSTRGSNYCAGWEVEVVGGDQLREVSNPKPPGTFEALQGNLG